jgi:hypothetical protein
LRDEVEIDVCHFNRRARVQNRLILPGNRQSLNTFNWTFYWSLRRRLHRARASVRRDSGLVQIAIALIGRRNVPKSPHLVDYEPPRTSERFIPQLASSNSAHARTQECQPGTGSRCRSRSKSFSRPAICEYFRLRILNQVLFSRSSIYGADFFFATTPSRSSLHTC